MNIATKKKSTLCGLRYEINFFIYMWYCYQYVYTIINIVVRFWSSVYLIMQMDTFTVLPDCWITATENLVETKKPFKPRPSSVEPPRTETSLLDDSELKEPRIPEFKDYWHKAHLILRAFPQVKAKTDGKYQTSINQHLWWYHLSISISNNIFIKFFTINRWARAAESWWLWGIWNPWIGI